MARYIKADGKIEEVHPTNGTEFSLQEMKAFVGGYLEAIKLTSKEVMYVNEEFVRLQLPINARATEVLHQHRPDHAHYPLCGDVLIASLAETGDEPDILRIPVEPVILPCSECGSENYPNYHYELAGMSGVLCKKCLGVEIANLNMVLNTEEDYLEVRNEE